MRVIRTLCGRKFHAFDRRIAARGNPISIAVPKCRYWVHPPGEYPPGRYPLAMCAVPLEDVDPTDLCRHSACRKAVEAAQRSAPKEKP